MKILKVILLFKMIIFTLIACESESDKRRRLESEKQTKIELEQQERFAVAEREKENERVRVEAAVILEQERKEQALYNMYINNVLFTGATPYSKCYGGNPSCDEWGCSEIIVLAPQNSDVIVTIKSEGSIGRHAYILAGRSYTFKMPNGIYQPFFYYGKGWNPEKEMKKTTCGTVMGGFISEESFGKDDLQNLNNGSLRYELILQPNGNFSTIPSDSNEAL